MMAVSVKDQQRGQLRHNEPMAKHTTWRVGGPAAVFYEPKDLADIAFFLQQLPEHEPVFWLGLGSNLLVRDGGINGSVIATSAGLRGLTKLSNTVVRAEAGVPCAKVAKFCVQHNLFGAEFFAGIPGTVGGALAMNAGAFGGETWPIVAEVETLDRTGKLRVRSPADFSVSYRHVSGPKDEWFVAARFTLTTSDDGHAATRVKELLERRNRTQPTGIATCGSVFRNPPGDFAGRLIEAAGLKGYRIGGAQVTEKHANFIANTGRATAQDIEQLIVYIVATVRAHSGVTLEPEVHIVGEVAS